MVLNFGTAAHDVLSLYLYSMRTSPQSQFLGTTRIVAVGIVGSVVTIQRPRGTIAVVGIDAETQSEPSRTPLFQPRLSGFGASVPMQRLPDDGGGLLYLLI